MISIKNSLLILLDAVSHASENYLAQEIMAIDTQKRQVMDAHQQRQDKLAIAITSLINSRHRDPSDRNFPAFVIGQKGM
jgi:hypothetical protein